MSLKSRIYAFVDVILRVPPLFVIDEFLRTSGPFPPLGLPFEEGVDPRPKQEYVDGVLNPYYYKVVLVTVIKLFIASFGCTVSLCVFLLCTKNLVTVYTYIMSVAIVLVSYWSNVSCVRPIISAAVGLQTDVTKWSLLEDLLLFRVTKLLHPSSYAFTVAQNLMVQSALASLFVFVHLGPRYPWLQKILPVSFIGPTLLTILPIPANLLRHAPVFAALLPLALVQFVLWSSAVPIVQSMYSAYQHVRNVLSNFGMATLVETEWNRLNVPCVLRTFWLLRVAEHAISLIINHEDTGLPVLTVAYQISKSILVGGCETLPAVLGMTSVVSYLCHYMGCLFKWALLTDEDDDKHIGTVSAILFYILALQTGLTGLEPDKRLVRLCRNFCLLFTALLHFVHNIVNPLLLSLSASHNPALHRHIRALAVCVFLVVFPVALLVFLWSHHNISTWLLAVSAFSVEVIVKVIVSLMIYSLFLLDAYRSTFWEKLDDYVYYIRAFGHTVEFCFGILLFFNGAWILAFEAGGAIRAIMMCLHAYFNIWCDARAGWRVFMKRRTAVNKINSLPEASSEQLQSLDDVCAICYQEMRSAKITRCNHFFHGVCLRKWLYVQDRCPLCHDILYKVSSQEHLSQ